MCCLRKEFLFWWRKLRVPTVPQLYQALPSVQKSLGYDTCTYTHDTVHERVLGGSVTCIFPIRMSQTKGDVVDTLVTYLRIFWRRPGWQLRVAGRPYPSNVYTQNNNKKFNVRSLNIMFLPGCRLRFIWNQYVTSWAYRISFLVKLDILIEMESIFLLHWVER